MHRKKIYIVDVSSMFFRAFYAIRPLTSAAGIPVNAVYGFISMLVKLIKEKNPEHIVFCYDRKDPSFRKELYAEYKANRTEMPDDLQVQMPFIRQVAPLFGIAAIEVPLFEADDLIGTIAVMAEKEGFDSYIVSGDKDFCQLIGPHVFLYDTMKDLIFDAAMVKDKHGVYPDQFIDFLAITGDTSDNIPGVAGIGPKGAQKLLEQFSTLEKIYENIEQVSSSSIKAKLQSSKEMALLSKRLVTIVTDVKIDRSIQDFKRLPFQKIELRSFFHELNFKTFEKILDLPMESKLEVDIEQSNEANQRNEIQQPHENDLANAVLLHPWQSETVQSRLLHERSFSFVHGSMIAFAFGPDLYVTELSNCNLDFAKLAWTGFDLKKIWSELGLAPEPARLVDWDLMLGAYVLRAADSSDFKKLAIYFLKQELILEDDAAAPQNCKKIYQMLLQLDQVVRRDLEEKDLMFVYEKLERPIVALLYQMEKKGIRLDLEFLKKFSDELSLELVQQEQKIHAMANEKFNIASPKQLGVVLFEKMGIPSIKKTKTGYSTDNDVLEKMDHPIGKEIIHYREVAKLKSTYVDTLPALADQAGRVHTHFNQALTATGRFSSTDPNLQNIPIKTEKGQRVRRAFISSPGKKLLSVDYSQIELRVLAHISNDAGLIRAFSEDLDIHAATAAEVFMVPLNSVTKEQRRIAKAVNFGIAYGQGAFGLAETLSIPRKEASEIIDRYFQKFSGIKDYIENTIKSAHEKKYVETLFGRRRYIAELDNSNAMVRKFGERAAINAPIQGTASDLVKMAMIELGPQLQPKKIDMLLQVHDELIFEGNDEDLKLHLPWIKKTMEGVAQLRVPLRVNHAIGNNWDEAH